MRPGARVQAAIEVLDAVFAGTAAERALTGWARGARYAGSKDRAAVRDHVFDALRRLRSSAWAGGLGDVAPEAMNGRQVMAGLLAGQGADLAPLFDGSTHAPAPLDRMPDPGPLPEAVALDLPEWLLERLRAAQGADAGAIAAALRDRAPVILRVNTAKTTRPVLIDRLVAAGHAADAHPLSPIAVTVEGAPRGLTALPEFEMGHFELQDAGSQAVIDRLPEAARVLDLCAGGGGKALAYAARTGAEIVAHDADPARMRDLPVRAARAGAAIETTTTPEALAPFDGIIADVPCSGSGSWRRAPEAKWRLTPERLAELTSLQDTIIDRAVAMLAPGGWLAYVTCSLLREENEARVEAALDRHPSLVRGLRWDTTPLDGADGFHLSLLGRPA
ncbi:RsmB/NOP family class I SAM-dependent RNA methyltransferase [Jannaschia sp. KMU-145]|uniref:RsmB/NOP family class I SAM-dependent RNA methyltransferase n=1 Tax=Jannaschia halovivens TaxID=3388667 RepID=UPI00396AFFCB